jgi:hypothetical protein
MLKLLLVTLGTWSLVSLFLVGVLGFLICLRETKGLHSGWKQGRKITNELRAHGSDEEKRQTSRAESCAYR